MRNAGPLNAAPDPYAPEATYPSSRRSGSTSAFHRRNAAQRERRESTTMITLCAQSLCTFDRLTCDANVLKIVPVGGLSWLLDCLESSIFVGAALHALARLCFWSVPSTSETAALSLISSRTRTLLDTFKLKRGNSTRLFCVRLGRPAGCISCLGRRGSNPALTGVTSPSRGSLVEIELG
jgi:hypothetical protein